MKVVMVTPNEADGALATGFLRDQGIEATTYPSMALLPSFIGPGVGCIVLVEEALVQPDLQVLHQALEAQPPWSDMPLLLIAAQGRSLASLGEEVFPISGNVTVLQRPLHPVSLVSAVHVARRSRARQYQVRDLLAERDRAVKQRDEFLAMLAHELRNPLAPIRNAVYLLGTLQNTDPLFIMCRAMIDKQASHITRLVDDLLDVSRLELGKLELRTQRVDLNEIVTAAVEATTPMTSAQRHRVKVHRAPRELMVKADPVRLEQAVGNLIVNAAKFTPAGGSIDVSAAADGDFGVITVADNGVGIRPEMLDTIFELFAQSEVTLARSQGGLGIGLTLVKRLVELHGGTVHAASAGLGMGSSFRARLPLLLGRGAERDEVAAVPVPSMSKRILIAEDGDDTRESLGLLVESWSHKVIYAANGPDAVRVARESKPDIALIDIGLPGFDGYRVAREIRGEDSPWARNVRLIALTGYGQQSDRVRAHEAGFDVHILKPVDPAMLKQLIVTER